MLKKRTLALLLSLTMLLSLLTPTALATEGEGSGTTQEEVVKSNEDEQTDQPGATENGDAKDENQDPQQPTTGDEEQPTGQDEPKNEDETKGEDGQPGEEPKQPEQTGDEQPTEEQGEETETPEEPQEPETDYESMPAEDLSALLDSLTEEEAQEILDNLSAEKYDELVAYWDSLAEEPQDNGIVDFTDVAPLVEMDVEVVTPGILKAALLGAAGRPADPYPEQLPKNADGVETSKKVDGPDDNGNYTITMESFVTGSVKAGEVKPCDIVLVLDMSTSMKQKFSSGGYSYKEAYPGNTQSYNRYYVKFGSNWREVTWCTTCGAWTNGCEWYYGTHYAGTKYTPKTAASDTNTSHTQFYSRTYTAQMTRLGALQNAATNFVTKVAEKEEANRIAVVGFHDYGIYLTGSGADNALLDAKTNENAIKNAINGINNNSLKAATDHNDGLQLARNIFAADNSDQQRQKVVVMITDGEPEPLDSGNWSAQTVKGAIEYSYELKNSYNASVYTVSVMPGSNAENPTSQMDLYMSYVSSNYPDAQYTGTNTSTTNKDTIIRQITPGTRADTGGKSYYLSAGDTSALEDIFGQIADQTGGATIELTAETVVKDVVSRYFTLPENATKDDISIYTADATGQKDADGKYEFGTWKKSNLEATIGTDENGNQTVSVTGFDFNRNFVADTGRVEGDVSQAGNFYGRKLIIQFQVKAKDAFWGGNAVPTNDPSSGIYNGDGVVENFEHPTADVKLNVPEITAVGKTIYYGNSAPTADDLFQMTVPADDWKTAYVKINTPEAGSISNEECGQYTGSITVEPTYEGKYGEVSKSAKAWVHVLEPSAEWEDITIYLGNQPKFTNPTSLKWADPNTGHTAGTPEGTAPTATSFAYEPTANAKYEDCTQVQPTFTLNGKNFSGNQFTVHVLKPTVTWTDCQKYYGESLSGFTATPVSVTWADSQDNKTTATAGQDAAPALSYDFTIAGGETVMPNKDVNVSVKTKINGTDVTSHTTYGWQKAKGVCVDCTAAPKEAQFRIHPLTCTLTISKSGWDTIDENQCFLFKYKRTVRNDVNATIEGTVTVQGNGSVRITGLPIGTYQVSEDENWSWRYQLNGGAQSATLTPDDSAGTLAFKNDRNNGKWLNGCSFAVNFWKSENEIIRKPTPNTTN